MGADVRAGMEHGDRISPASSDSPDVSIIIVNRNTRELLDRCLGSIEQFAGAPRVEVIVVDNASDDGSVEMVEAKYGASQLIRNDTNTGFAFPNNQGMSASHGRYILLLNSDTEILPHSLEHLIAFMDSHPRVGASGPLLRYPDGRVQISWLNFDTPWRYFCEMTGLGGLFPASRLFAGQERLYDPSRTAKVEGLLGAAILVRREVVESLGGFDEQFRIHCNDVDWCLRMERAGWDRYFVPAAEVIHHFGGTLKVENRDFRLQGELVENLFDYHRKNFGPAGLLWFRIWTVVGYSLRCARYFLRNRRKPEPASRKLVELCAGIVRAAWAGDPHRFHHTPST